MVVVTEVSNVTESCLDSPKPSFPLLPTCAPDQRYLASTNKKSPWDLALERRR
jgi:hypothetical protein